MKLSFKKSFQGCMACSGYACKRFKSQDQFGIERELVLCQGCSVKDTVKLVRIFTWRERLRVLIWGSI